MRTLTRLSRAAALPLAASLLVACGGGSGSDDSSASGDSSASASESAGSDDATQAYCDELRDAQKSFAAFDQAQPDPQDLQAAFETFQQLADDAPPAIESDWATIDQAVTTLEDSLGELGLEISDLAALQQGQIPEGVDPQQLQQVAQKLQSLAGPDFAAAGEAIEKHAKDECDIDLSPASGSSDGASPSASPSESPSS